MSSQEEAKSEELTNETWLNAFFYGYLTLEGIRANNTAICGTLQQLYKENSKNLEQRLMNSSDAFKKEWMLSTLMFVYRVTDNHSELWTFFANLLNKLNDKELTAYFLSSILKEEKKSDDIAFEIFQLLDKEISQNVFYALTIMDGCSRRHIKIDQKKPEREDLFIRFSPLGPKIVKCYFDNGNLGTVLYNQWHNTRFHSNALLKKLDKSTAATALIALYNTNAFAAEDTFKISYSKDIKMMTSFSLHLFKYGHTDCLFRETAIQSPETAAALFAALCVDAKADNFIKDGESIQINGSTEPLPEIIMLYLVNTLYRQNTRKSADFLRHLHQNHLKSSNCFFAAQYKKDPKLAVGLWYAAMGKNQDSSLPSVFIEHPTNILFTYRWFKNQGSKDAFLQKLPKQNQKVLEQALINNKILQKVIIGIAGLGATGALLPFLLIKSPDWVPALLSHWTQHLSSALHVGLNTGFNVLMASLAVMIFSWALMKGYLTYSTDQQDFKTMSETLKTSK